MRATKEEFTSQFLKILYDNKNIVVALTDKCNFKCVHCQQGQGYGIVFDEGTMSKNLIDQIINNIYDDGFCICLCGGEAMLKPDLVEYITIKAHTKKCKVIIGTNGFWYNNKELINLIKKIKPEYIRLSVDIFHQEFVSLDNLQELINNFEDSEVKIFGGSIYNYECAPGQEEKFNSLKLLQEVTPCVYFGNAHKFLKEKEILKPNQYVFCRGSGIVIFPDGNIFMECEMESHGCFLGNIKDTKFIDLIPKLKKSRPFYYIQPGENINNIYEICKRDKHHVLDNKWNMNSISKNQMGNSFLYKAIHSNIYAYSIQEIHDYYDPFYSNIVR